MSAFSGRQGKGAARRRLEIMREQGVGRTFIQDWRPLITHLGGCSCPPVDVPVIGNHSDCPLDGWMDMGLEGPSLRVYKHADTREVLRLTLTGQVAS